MFGGIVDRVVAEAEAGPLEGGPVEVGVELVGDVHALGRGGGGGGVLEVDVVGEGIGWADEILRAVAGGAELVVGVDRVGNSSNQIRQIVQYPRKGMVE